MVRSSGSKWALRVRDNSVAIGVSNRVHDRVCGGNGWVYVGGVDLQHTKEIRKLLPGAIEQRIEGPSYERVCFCQCVHI